MDWHTNNKHDCVGKKRRHGHTTDGCEDIYEEEKPHIMGSHSRSILAKADEAMLPMRCCWHRAMID